MDGIQLGGIKAKLSGILNGTECSLSQFYADAVEAKYRQAKQEITSQDKLFAAAPHLLQIMVKPRMLNPVLISFIK
mgnify:CR=1 FL=1